MRTARAMPRACALVGTLKQDILGYESAVGYYNANGWQDPRPNVGGVISRQSFSSKKWLADAGEALRRLIEHLENCPYGERILAYHIATVFPAKRSCGAGRTVASGITA